MGVNITFNVKDERQNVLGHDALVDEFTTKEFTDGHLDGVKAIDNKLQLELEYGKTEGTRLSEPVSLSQYGLSDPNLKMKSRISVPEETSVKIETAITEEIDSYEVSRVEETRNDFKKGILNNTDVGSGGLELGKESKTIEHIPSSYTSSSTATTRMPFYTYYKNSRTQLVILEEELLSMGMVPGTYIDGLELKCSSLPGASMVDFRIRLQNTDQVISTSWTIEGWTQVYGSKIERKEEFIANDWYRFEFDTPFIWDGRNLLVELVRSLSSIASSGGNHVWTGTGQRQCGWHSDSGVYPFDDSSPTTESFMLQTRFSYKYFVDEGTRVAKSLSLNGLGKAIDSFIGWNSTVPVDTEFIVEVAINEMSDEEPDNLEYVDAINSQALPVISVLDDLDGKYLWIRQTLKTNDSSFSPELHALSVIVEGDTAIKIVRLPDEQEWEEQVNGQSLTHDLSEDLTDKYLWVRQTLETEDPETTPSLDWFIIYNADEDPYACVRVDANDEIKIVDNTGVVIFEDVVNLEKSTLFELNEEYKVDELVGSRGLPFDTYYSRQRVQYVLLAEELLKVGFMPGSSLEGLEIRCGSTIPSQNILDFRLKLQNTDQDESVSWITSGWSTVLGPVTIPRTDIIANDWYKFEFDVPFVWDGRNLLIEMTRTSSSNYSGSGNTQGNYVWPELKQRYCRWSATSRTYPFDGVTPTVEDFVVQTNLYARSITVHVFKLESEFNYARSRNISFELEEEDFEADLEIPTVKSNVSSIAIQTEFEIEQETEGRVSSVGLQVEQGLDRLYRSYVSSFALQVEVSLPIVIDFEGFGVVSEAVVGTDFIIVGNAVTGVVVFPASVRIEEGTSVVVHAKIRPDDAISRNVYWYTEDYGIASVIGDGERAQIRANSEGITTITVEVEGGYTATCKVIVMEKVIKEFDFLKILLPSFAEIVTLNNTDIIDLTIERELSGQYGIDFELPVGVLGWNEIKRGRYVEAEGQKFKIEHIAPARDKEDRPTLKVTCSHVFFELENFYMPNDTMARAPIQNHLEYILRDTGFSVILTDNENLFYEIDRVVEYQAFESRFEAFQRVFSIFGGYYRIDDFTIEIIPPRPPVPESAVVLEYGVTNSTIEKVEDDTNVVTVLYATGGEVEGEALKRTVYAPSEIRALYRREQVRFVDFGDIRLWGNFVYVTDQYIEKYSLPRTTYTLTVAELKHIAGIDELYPERDFAIDVGKMIQVKDSELGIDVFRIIQRYSYKPLEPDNLSSVVVGDKPFDITFEEVTREGIVGEEEGEWIYDEGTGEWVFFPEFPDPGEAEGVDYELAILNDIDSDGPASIQYRYFTGEDKYEESTLIIEANAHSSGIVTVFLNLAMYNIEIEEDDTAEEVAEKIGAVEYLGWDVNVVDNTVVFTAQGFGPRKYSARYVYGLTGAIGQFVTIKGKTGAMVSDWRHSNLPFYETFNSGDQVQVKPISENPYYSVSSWYGDGEGFDPRLFIMDDNKTAYLSLLAVGGYLEVSTRNPSSVTDEQVTLNGRIDNIGKYTYVERGFVWGYSSGPTIGNCEGQISSGSGGEGNFSAPFVKPPGDPLDKKYYFRAYAKTYDFEKKRDIVEYGSSRSFTFAYEARTVEVAVFIAQQNVEYTSSISVTPGVGSYSYPHDEDVEFYVDPDSLPQGTVFERWAVQKLPSLELVTNNIVDNPMTLKIDHDYRITAILSAPAITVWIEQEEGTGSIQIANSPDGPRQTFRPLFAMRFSQSVYVWTIPDDESGDEEWTEDSDGVGYQPRVFEVVPNEFREYHAKIRWKPLMVCEQRCIFIHPDNPPQHIGVDGNVWLKYQR